MDYWTGVTSGNRSSSSLCRNQALYLTCGWWHDQWFNHHCAHALHRWDSLLLCCVSSARLSPCGCLTHRQWDLLHCVSVNVETVSLLSCSMPSVRLCSGCHVMDRQTFSLITEQQEEPSVKELTRQQILDIRRKIDVNKLKLTVHNKQITLLRSKLAWLRGVNLSLYIKGKACATRKVFEVDN